LSLSSKQLATSEHSFANNLHATVKAPLELSNWTEQMRFSSNPNQTSFGFQIAPIA
jgi:hypothetical protein